MQSHENVKKLCTAETLIHFCKQIRHVILANLRFLMYMEQCTWIYILNHLILLYMIVTNHSE